MLQWQPDRLQAGGISHAASVKLGCAPQGAPTLRRHKTGAVIAAVNLYFAIQGYAPWHMYGPHDVAVKQRRKETEVIGARPEGEVSLQEVRGGEVGRKAICTDAEGRGQSYTEPRQVHLAHVAARHRIDGQRIAGPTAGQLTRKILARQGQDVLFAHMSVDGGIEFARMFLVESVEVHAEVHCEVRLWCAQPQVRQVEVCAVHRETATQTVNAQPTLLTEVASPNLDIQF